MVFLKKPYGVLPFMIRRFLISIVLLLGIIISIGISPALAEKQYTQTKQTYQQAEPSAKQESYKQEPYTQSQQSYEPTEPPVKQEPYTQTQQSYEQAESESK